METNSANETYTQVSALERISAAIELKQIREEVCDWDKFDPNE